MISSPEEIAGLHINLTRNICIGICGATSTPRWLMEKVEEKLKELSLKFTI